jgi:hypothetical protein
MLIAFIFVYLTVKAGKWFAAPIELHIVVWP